MDSYIKCLWSIYFNRNKAPQPNLYSNKPYHVIPEVGFRIAALRETFEECGLLLAHHLPYKGLNQHEITKWQKVVHQDASQLRLLNVNTIWIGLCS